MPTVGARELKTRLGRYLEFVRDGATLIVTQRGRPVAELRPIAPVADNEDAVLDELVALGRITWKRRAPLPPFEAVSIPGPTATEAVLADREDRL